MQPFEEQRGGFTISDEPSRLQPGVIHGYLSQRSYWAQGRDLETVTRSIEHSLCLGVYYGEEQVGFARLVTDQATFAWLCDVFILEEHRGHGLGKWLVQCISRHPALQGLRRVLLATSDAHTLYQDYGGFQPLESPERFLERFNPNPSRRA